MGQFAEAIRSQGGRLAAVAVTPTFAQQAFAASLSADFPLLSDWGSAVAEAYGVRYDVWKEHTGLAKRSVFVIDREGIIRYRWVTDDALVMPPLEEAIGVLSSLAAHR